MSVCKSTNDDVVIGHVPDGLEKPATTTKLCCRVKSTGYKQKLRILRVQHKEPSLKKRRAEEDY